jgi:hypothetical protein
MSERILIKRERFDHEHEATIWAYADHGSDHLAAFEVEVVAMNSDHHDRYYAGQDIDHAMEAVAAARNSGFNFDRFRAEQRLREREERGELDLY